MTAMTATSAAERPLPSPGQQRRRNRTTTPRNRSLGPLKFSPAELADVRAAAARAGLSPGAYAARSVTAAAQQDLPTMPATHRELIGELIHTRVELTRLAALLPAAEPQTLLPVLTAAALRVEDAADALVQHARWKAAPT